MTGMTLSVGGNFITIDSSGVTIFGTMVNINSGGSPLSGSAGSAVSPLSPTDPDIAATANPGENDVADRESRDTGDDQRDERQPHCVSRRRRLRRHAASQRLPTLLRTIPTLRRTRTRNTGSRFS